MPRRKTVTAGGPVQQTMLFDESADTEAVAVAEDPEEPAPVYGVSMRRNAESYKPEETVNPPGWVQDACFCIHWLRESDTGYRKAEDRYVKTAEEAAAFYKAVFGDAPPAPFVFWRGLWRTPDSSNMVFHRKEAPRGAVTYLQGELPEA